MEWGGTRGVSITGRRLDLMKSVQGPSGRKKKKRQEESLPGLRGQQYQEGVSMIRAVRKKKAESYEANAE